MMSTSDKEIRSQGETVFAITDSLIQTASCSVDLCSLCFEHCTNHIDGKECFLSLAKSLIQRSNMPNRDRVMEAVKDLVQNQPANAC